MAALSCCVLSSVLGQNPNQIRDRGQTPVQSPSQTLDRGRIFSQQSVPMAPFTMNGLLVDAGCPDRSQFNLTQPPATVPAPAPLPQQKGTRQPGAVSAAGISVDSKTADAERSEALNQLVPDIRNRMEDPHCAVTATTRAFAILMPNGRLLDLDEGGNTRAEQAIQASRAGQAMLSGQGPVFKPHVQIVGHVDGDRLLSDSVRLTE
jgi:hypothetical protein